MKLAIYSALSVLKNLAHVCTVSNGRTFLAEPPVLSSELGDGEDEVMVWLEAVERRTTEGLGPGEPTYSITKDKSLN